MPGANRLRKGSWGVYGASHTTVAQYLVDLDGNLATTDDQTLFVINQRYYADQTTLGGTSGGQWSGWYSSQVRLEMRRWTVRAFSSLSPQGCRTRPTS